MPLTAEQLQAFYRVIPELAKGKTGGCPWCGAPGFALEDDGEGGKRAVCRMNGCSAAEIRSGMRELLQRGAGSRKVSNGTNGAEHSHNEPFTSLNSCPAVPRKQSPKEVGPPQRMAAHALYGLTGEICQGIAPHTEASLSGLVANFLVYTGNMVGRGPHFRIEGARHGTNLFGVTVGPTAAGRKGTASNRIELVISSIDSNYTKTNISRGLSSGEGLIHHVRDPRSEMVAVKQGRRHTGEYEEQVVDQGVSDKRKLILEDEFANVLKVMGREGNTLSSVLRSAWDNKPLGNLTKTNADRATDAHISILGHISTHELRKLMTATDANNGFANRFLWIAVSRSKLLPLGGGDPAIGAAVRRLHETLIVARDFERVEFDDASAELWKAIYGPLTQEWPGLFGAVVSRAAPQVLRLSTIYAILDASPIIEVCHLLAALAVWDYSEATARYLFGQLTGDDIADRIDAALTSRPEGMASTDVYKLLGNNVGRDRIMLAADLLTRLGRLSIVEMHEGGRGRPQELWKHVGHEENELNQNYHLSGALKAAEALGISVETPAEASEENELNGNTVL